jgi:hypothetical protein
MAAIPSRIFDKSVTSHNGADFCTVDGEFYWRAADGDTSDRTFATLNEAEANWMPVMRQRRAAKCAEQQAAQAEQERKAAEAASFAAQVRSSGTHCYVRFGKLPEGGRSRDYRENRLEAGVCVYDAFLFNGTLYLDWQHADAVSGMFVRAGGNAHIVEGKQVGTCSDGSPVLRDCTAKRTRRSIQIIY